MDDRAELLIRGSALQGQKVLGRERFRRRRRQRAAAPDGRIFNLQRSSAVLLFIRRFGLVRRRFFPVDVRLQCFIQAGGGTLICRDGQRGEAIRFVRFLDLCQDTLCRDTGADPVPLNNKDAFAGGGELFDLFCQMLGDQQGRGIRIRKVAEVLTNNRLLLSALVKNRHAALRSVPSDRASELQVLRSRQTRLLHNEVLQQHLVAAIEPIGPLPVHCRSRRQGDASNGNIENIFALANALLLHAFAAIVRQAVEPCPFGIFKGGQISLVGKQIHGSKDPLCLLLAAFHMPHTNQKRIDLLFRKDAEIGK